MRLLLVSHGYPPDGTAGAETYAARVATMLAARAYDVRVFTAVKDIARVDGSVHERVHDGVPVTEVVNNLFADDFEATWDDPRFAARFSEVLGRFAPDVVHVHHLLYLSAGVLDACRERGVAVVFTLHDFWLGCARFGQLLHADGTRCGHVEPERCGTCLPSLPWRQSTAARRVGRALAGLRRATGVDLSGPLTAMHRARATSPSTGFEPPPGPVASEYAARVVERTERLVTAANAAVDRFIVPARFQIPWFERLGLDVGRFRVVSTGLDWDELRSGGGSADSSGPGATRFLFLGTLVPHKGAHVLLEAWGRLPESDRARSTLRIFGPDRFRPAYAEELRARASRLEGVEVGEPLDRAGVARELERADVLVVPSLWLEVRPLVMVEAHAAGLRVLASDLGGMAEVLEDGVPGRTFAPGDADALARAMGEEIARAPDRDTAPRGPTPAFPTWESMLDRVLEVTEEAMERRRGLLG